MPGTFQLRTALLGTGCNHYSNPSKEKKFVSSVNCPKRLWDSHPLLYNRHRDFLPREQSGRNVTLTTHLHEVAA